MTVSGPVKPSARSVSAARNPASEAPTMTIWPRSLKGALAPLLLTRVLHLLVAIRSLPLDKNRLNRARSRCTQDGLALRFVRGRIVPERLLSMQLEGAGG